MRGGLIRIINGRGFYIGYLSGGGPKGEKRGIFLYAKKSL
jgi:hypothetical protein